MRVEMNPQLLARYQLEGCQRIPDRFLAYLFTTGKNELFLRDLLAAELHNSLGLVGNEYVAREWVRQGVTTHPHDLAFLDGEEVKFIVEGKSWIHDDALKSKKLNNPKSYVRKGMDRDVDKCRESLSGLKDVNGYISTILYSVDVGAEERHNFQNSPLTYAKSHKRGVKKAGSFEALLSESTLNFNELLGRYGNFESIRLLDSTCNGMRVVADFYVCEILAA